MSARATPSRRAERRCFRSSALPLFLSLVLLPLAASAQTDERLPDLTPRAFEIRGDLQISLPNLERQPLRGFAPPPRTYVVPGSRQTYVAPYAQRLDDLPDAPLGAPEPPAIAALSPLTGRIDAGFGRYLSRLGRLTISRGGLGLDLGYSGYTGFDASPDGFTPIDVGADAFDGHVAYTTTGPTRLGAELSGDYHRYSRRDLADSDLVARTVGGRAFIDSARPDRTPFDLALRFASTQMESGDSESRETRLEPEGSVTIGRVRLDAAGTLAGLGDEGLGESLTAYSTGAALRLSLGRARLDVGARVLGYDASSANGGSSSQNVGPIVDFEVPLTSTLRAFARTQPRLERRGLAGLYRANPYTDPGSVGVLPGLYPLDAEGGVEVQGRNIRLTAFGGTRYASTHLYFARLGGAAGGLYDARYGEVFIVRGGGAVTVYAGALRATAEAEVRSATLQGDDFRPDRDLPYYAPLVGRLSLAAPFAQSRGLLQVTGTFESARPTETEGVDAPAWATLDAEAHYLFAAGFGGLVRAERLAGRAEEWPGFPRPPATVLAGFRVRW